MAFVLTYTSLTKTIKDYLERQDPRLVDSIPTFMMLGQRRITRDLKILNIKNDVNDVLQVGVQTVQKPVDWLMSSYLNIGTGVGNLTKVNMELRSLEYCDAYWPNQTLTGQPKYFCDLTASTFKVVPTPDFAYPYQLVYYQLPALLDTATGTNVLSATIPDTLIYACLLETASYLKDDERLPLWTQYYTQSRDAVSQEDIQRIQVGFNTNSH